jgi:ubiquinone/menaquinone biosynthesis C-methylase UbiE
MRHHDRVRLEFSKQAVPFSQTASIRDSARLQRLVDAVAPARSASVLDIATGPGYVALAFAEVCREVVGVDLTPEMLELAESHRRSRQLSNASFQRGAAEKLPFPAKRFDIVVSRLAIHHCRVPARVIAEAVRVCAPGGTIAIEDLVVSEHPRRAAYQNRVEKLRDPSHTRALSATGLIRLLSNAGLEIQSINSGELQQDAEKWLATSATPEREARKVRALLLQDEKRDLSGLCPFHFDGRLQFRHNTLTVVAHKT